MARAAVSNSMAPLRVLRKYLPVAAVGACIVSLFPAVTNLRAGVSYLKVVASSPVWTVRFRSTEYAALERTEPRQTDESPENAVRLCGPTVEKYVAVILHCASERATKYKAEFPTVRVAGASSVLPVVAVGMLSEEAYRQGVKKGALPVIGPPAPVSVESEKSKGDAVNVIVIVQLPSNELVRRGQATLIVDGLFDVGSFKVPLPSCYYSDR